LAETYLRAGRYRQARLVLEPAWEKSLQTLGVEHRISLGLLNSLADLRSASGRDDLAIGLYRRATAINGKLFGPDHLDAIVAKVNLAGALEEGGHYAEAEGLLLDALHRYQRQLGRDHPQTAVLNSLLGSLYLGWGQLEKAAPMLEMALARLREVRGETHPDTLAMMHNLALLYRKQGDYGKAERFNTQAARW
jgi:tetratricopeptide (TPR) repeat protein